MNIFELGAKITLDSSSFERGISLAKGSMKAIGTAIGAAGAAVGAFAKESLEAYASYEQLVGGVETLFGDSADKIKEYADAAYQTAGMSANDYMETVTAFSASLINSLEGDTDKAADQADKAIRDMSDNANKMGTDIENIQNAYRGFARGNFTMLDNLSLGYAGTKEGMEELLARAEEIAGVHFDISSYSDIIDAIHVIQEDMGIAKATEMEAATTIEGSVKAMQGAWKNLVVEIAKDNGDIDGSIDKLIDSVLTVGDNILPRVEKILNGIMTLIRKGIPRITKLIPKLVSQYLPELVNLGTELLASLTEGITESLPELLTAAMQIMEELASGIYTLLPMLANIGLQIILTLAQYLTDNMPTLAPKAVDMIITIIDAILDSNTLSLLLDAALGIIMALADYLLKPETINKLVQKVPEIVEKIVTGLVNNVSKLLRAAVEIIKALYDYLTDWDNLVTIFEAGKDIIGAVISGIGAVTYELLSAVVEIAGKVAEKFGIGEYWEAGVQVINDFMQGVRDQFPFLADLVDGIASFINDSLMLDEGEFVKPERPDLSGITEDAASRIAGIKAQAQLERAANRVTGGIESFWDAQTSKGHAGTSHRRARGGIVRHPELALVGEAGAEAIMPLENNTEWIDMLAKRIGGGSTINVTLNVEGGIASDYDVDRLVDRLAETIDRKLGERNVAANRAVGGVSW